MVTATATEFRAVLDCLQKTYNDSPNYSYETGEFHCPDGRIWEVWLVCAGQGNVQAALCASQAIQEIHPDLLVFLGTAGSLKDDVGIGDVVFATHVYGYESGRVGEEGILARPDVAIADGELTGLARRLAGNRSWQGRIPDGSAAAGSMPEAHVAPICAGEKIIADTGAEIRERLHAHFNGAAAVEMEGLGFLSAAHYWGNVRAAVIRGISDRLSGKDSASDKVRQPMACRNAAAFLFELISHLRIPEGRRVDGPESQYRLWGGPMANRTFIPDSGDNGSSTLITRADLPAMNLVGQVIDGRYELVREIGRGALNAVWEAEERAFGRALGRVAVKLQPPEKRRRFLYFSREAELIASFDSPYLIPYRSAWTEGSGQLQGWSFIATGLADMSLRDRIDEERLKESKLLRMMLDVGRALKYLHSRGLVHGDVKPANILRHCGRWVLGDFGLTQKTGSSEPEGTIGYMAPERFEGKVTSKNDVYSYAVTAIIAATGWDRIESSTVVNTRIRVGALMRGAPDPPSIEYGAFPEAVGELLHRATRQDPKDRPTMADMIAAIEKELEGSS